MLESGINATRLFLSVTFNALGLALLLTAAWLLPHLLSLLISQGSVPG